jgi:exodeoxyribonuclease VIII
MTNVVTLPSNPFTPTPKADPVHIMLDTETLGLDGNAIILSIGAVVFDVDAGLKEEFYTDINPESFPGSVDISTIKWWMEQCHSGVPVPMAGVLALPAAMGLFNDYLLNACEGNTKRLVIWANGTDFDIPKLTNAYKLCGAKVPWGYNSVRDARTLYKVYSSYGLKPPELNKHNALADARWQAEYLVSIFRNLKEKLNVPE